MHPNSLAPQHSNQSAEAATLRTADPVAWQANAPALWMMEGPCWLPCRPALLPAAWASSCPAGWKAHPAATRVTRWRATERHRDKLAGQNSLQAPDLHKIELYRLPSLPAAWASLRQAGCRWKPAGSRTPETCCTSSDVSGWRECTHCRRQSHTVKRPLPAQKQLSWQAGCKGTTCRHLFY